MKDSEMNKLQIERRLRRLEETVGGQKNKSSFTNLKNFVKETWSGDVTFAEVKKEFNTWDLENIESFLEEYSEYVDGIPFQGDSGDEAIWKKLVNTNRKARLLQDLVDAFE